MYIFANFKKGKIKLLIILYYDIILQVKETRGGLDNETY